MKMPPRKTAKRKPKMSLKVAMRMWSEHVNRERTKKVSPERRREIALYAIRTRWARRDAERAAAEAAAAPKPDEAAT